METQLYQQYTQYLQTNRLPNGIARRRRSALRKAHQFYTLVNNTLYRRSKNSDTPLRKVIQEGYTADILYSLHNNPLAGHFGVNGVYNQALKRFYWPNMWQDIRNYIASCDYCQKRGQPLRQEPLHPIQTGQPFEKIGIDFVGPLPRTARGNHYLLVATDYATRWPEARATKDATAKTVANFLYEEIVSRHGCPKELLSDRGPAFRSQLILELCEKLGIKHRLASPYHPQTNGLTERYNKTLCYSLAKTAEEHGEEWDNYVAPTLFAYRTKQNETTQCDPFFLTYGREATLPIDIGAFSLNTLPEFDVERRRQAIEDTARPARRLAQERITQQQQKQKENYDGKVKLHTFLIGDQVLRYRAALQNRYDVKFQPKWDGPFWIHQVLPKGAYKLRTTDGKILSSPFHSNSLKPYRQTKEREDDVYVLI